MFDFSRLERHKFAVHTTALVLMLGSAAALYWAANANTRGAEVALLLVFACANALILLV